MRWLLSLSCVFFAVPGLRADAADPSHIVFVLADDMGYGDAACYNPESKIETPTINQLAAEGMRFTDAHAAGPLCHLSRFGLMTGTYPFRRDVTVWPKKAVIREGETTLATLLRSAGYRTAMVGKWHLGFNENGYENPLTGGPVDRGFETFFGMRASTDIPPYFYIRQDRAVTPPTDHIAANNTPGWSPIQGEFWREGGIAPDLSLPEVLPRFTEEAISVIKAHDPKTPLFLYLAFPAPHTPWLPSPEFAGRSAAGPYGDFLMMVDAEVGKVMAALDGKGMSNDTLVMFSSDNGPTWYEEDEKRLGHRSAGPWRGMKADAWEAGHRIPFIARWPGKIAAGASSDETICFTDVMATFAEMLALDLPEGAGSDSYSFWPALQGKEQPPRPSLVIQSGSGLMTVRMDQWKLIDGLGSGGFSKPAKIKPEPGGPAGQLYDLSKDEAESENVYSSRPELVETLRSAMDAVVGEGRQN